MRSTRTNGAKGYKFAHNATKTFDIDGTVFGPQMRVACTAAQTTGACLFIGWFK